MSRQYNGSNQSARASGAPIAVAWPLTMAIWYFRDSAGIAQSQAVLALSNNGVTNQYSALSLDTSGNTYFEQNASGFVGSTSSGGAPQNQWVHLAGVAAASNNRSLYRNGAQIGSTNTTDISSGAYAPNGVDVGMRDRSSGITGRTWGKLAEAAIWNAALSLEEIRALSRGMSPLLIRPGNLVFYGPLWGTSGLAQEIDYVGGRVVTLTGSPPYFQHPPLPAPMLLGVETWIPQAQPVSGGPVYNDVVAGAIAFAGVTTESYSRVYNDARSGSLVLTGSVTEKKLYTDARAGSMVLNGNAVDRRTYVDAPVGTMALGGSIIEQSSGRIIYNDVVAGTLVLGGRAGDSVVVSVGFVQALFAGSAKATGAPLVLSGSKVVSVGNTIFVALGSGASGDPVEITDNLGNVYSEVSKRDTGSVYAGLHRADVTHPGTLTTITIDQPTNTGAYGAIALEFSNAGVVRDVGASSETSTDIYFNAYPGGTAALNSADSDAYAAGDLWLGAFAQESVATFLASSSGPALPAIEPTSEQRTSGGSASSNLSAGLLYYIAPKLRKSAALVGRYTSVALGTAVGVAVAPRIGILQGSLVFTGSVIESHSTIPIHFDAPAGTLNLSGSIVETWLPPLTQYDDAPAGSLVLAGSCASTHGKWSSDQPSGVLTFAGAATDSSRQNVTPIGILRLSGTLATSHEYISTSAGAIRIAGSAVEKKGYPDKPQGRIATAGTAVVSQRHHALSTGRLALSGSVVESWSHVGQRAGTISLSGTALTKRKYGDVVFGTIAVNGAAEDDYNISNFDVCAGVLKLVGVVSQSLVVSDDVDGRLRLGGTKTEFIEIEGAIFYDDFPAGLIELDGRLVFVTYDVQPGRNGRIVLAYESGRIVRSLDSGRVVGNLTGRLS